MSIAIGQVVDGKYRIVRLLGQGAMGAVFEGENTRIKRRVAIKVLHSSVAEKKDLVDRFEREAQAAGRIGSEHIVDILDLGELPDGARYLVMEYLEGESLGDRIKSSVRIPPALLLPMIRQLLVGLGAAHQAGIVHRDLKPDNVYLAKEVAGHRDFIKVLDFGVSKFSVLNTEEARMTATGAVMGTPYYMSPEQAKGAPIDRRSDVFSIGILLWEMITTTRLFRAENDLATLQLIINQPIKKPSLERPDCPQELERIVLKALSQDVSKRYQTANELAQDLEDLVRSEQLSQSARELSMYMRTLFRAELDSWEEARAQGTTLGEHLTQAGELTAPISESEFIEAIGDEDLEEEEPEEDDVPAKAPATVPGRRMSTPAIPAPVVQAGSGPAVARTATAPKTPPPTPVRASQPAIEASASAARGDATEHVAPLPPPAMVPRADVTPLPQRASNDSSPWPTTPTPHGGLAQGSWPQQANVIMPGDPNELPFSFEQAQKLKKQFLYVFGGIAALVFLIAIVKGAGGGESAAADRGDDDAETARPEPEREAPPAKAPIAEPPAAVPVDAGVAAGAPDAAVAVDEPPSVPPVVTKPPGKKPSGGGKRPPGGKKPPIRKFDPNAPIAPR